MITVKLFKYDSPNFFINKTLVDVATYTGVLKEETSVLDPSFEIETPNDLSLVNYVWINEFHRYYYVTKIVSVTNRLWRLMCHVDVLMTWKPQIKAHEAVIARQEGLYNLYLNDGSTFVVTQRSKVVQKNFPNGFTGSSYVLLVCGDQAPSNTVVNTTANEIVERGENSE